jgi:hypothetical protein
MMRWVFSSRARTDARSGAGMLGSLAMVWLAALI